MTRYFIVTPKSQLKRFVHEHDQKYFSNPVEVHLHHTHVPTRMLYVTDPARGGCMFPVDRSMLKSQYSLTRRQRIAAGIER